MSLERVQEVRERLFQLERKIKPLEWDASRNQINEFKRMELERLKVEHQTLQGELSGMQNKEV